MAKFNVKIRRYFHSNETAWIEVDADDAGEAERKALESDPNEPDIEWEVDWGGYEHGVDFDVVEIEKED